MIRIYCKQASKLVVEEVLLLWFMKRAVMILMTSRRDDDDHDLDDVKKERPLPESCGFWISRLSRLMMIIAIQVISFHMITTYCKKKYFMSYPGHWEQSEVWSTAWFWPYSTSGFNWDFLRLLEWSRIISNHLIKENSRKYFNIIWINLKLVGVFGITYDSDFFPALLHRPWARSQTWIAT